MARVTRQPAADPGSLEDRHLDCSAALWPYPDMHRARRRPQTSAHGSLGHGPGPRRVHLPEGGRLEIKLLTTAGLLMDAMVIAPFRVDSNREKRNLGAQL